MDATSSTTLKLITNTSGAFFGAFFAFIFGLITIYWTKWFERQSKDYNAMVKLEGILNEHLNTFVKNDYLIHGSIDALSRGSMTYNILRDYRLAEDIELLFLDVDFINEYFDYRDTISSLNHDFKATNHGNDILKEVVLSGNANAITINANTQALIENLTSINQMASALDDTTKSLLCVVRVKLRVDKIGMFGIKRLLWKPHHVTDQEAKEEMVELELESAETQEVSAKTILRATRNNKV